MSLTYCDYPAKRKIPGFMPTKRGESLDNPSSELRRLGQQFGAWFRSGIQNSGKNISQIAKELKVAPSQLYTFRDDCIDSTGRFKRPSKAMIRDIAAVVGADEDDGLRAMGFATEKGPIVPAAIAHLPDDAKQALSHFLVLAARNTPSSPTVDKRLDPEAMEVLGEFENLVENLSSEDRRAVLEHARALSRVARGQYKKRTDIIGKRSDIDDEPAEPDFDDE